MENIYLCRGKLSPEQIEVFLTAQNERYRREMVQHSDHHADDYEPYEGHPDGKDLYESYIESTPEWNAQFETPEFKIAALSLELMCAKQMIKHIERKLYDTIEAVEYQLSVRMDRMQEEIQLIAEAVTSLACCEPDDYDTQRQIEEELPSEFWQREF